MTRRVLLLAYHFHPDPAVGAKRPSALATFLRGEGWQVTVITATAPQKRLEEGIHVIHVSPPVKVYPRLMALLRGARATGAGAAGAGNVPYRSPSVPAAGWRGRLKRWYHSLEWLVDDRKAWGVKVVARLLALRARRGFDLVITSGPPMTVHLAGSVAKALFGARWLADFRDPWVGNGVWPRHVDSLPRRWGERCLEAHCCRRADWITATTPGIGVALEERYPGRPVVHLPNGFDGDPRLVPPSLGRLHLLYAGSLYFNRDPFPLLEALADLLARDGVMRSRVSLLLVGQCARWNGVDVAGWVAQRGLDDCVQVAAPVQASEVGRLMEEAQVLITFAQGQPQQIPAKVYDYVAAGREQLVIAEPESDTALALAGSGLARVVAPGDRAGLQEALFDFYRRYVDGESPFVAPPEVVMEFSRRHQHQRLLRLLQEGVA